MQLEAGELHREDVVLHGVAQGVQDGRSDVADGDRLEARGLQHGLGQADRRGLAVRAGDGEPVGRLAALADRAPARRVRRRPRPGCGPGRPRRAGPGPAASPGEVTIEVRLLAVDLGHACATASSPSRTSAAPTIRRVSAWAVACRAGGGVHHHHAGAEFDQGVRCGESGDADAGDHDAQPGPVGVPADQALQPRATWCSGAGIGAAHSRTTHSA